MGGLRFASINEEVDEREEEEEEDRNAEEEDVDMCRVEGLGLGLGCILCRWAIPMLSRARFANRPNRLTFLFNKFRCYQELDLPID